MKRTHSLLAVAVFLVWSSLAAPVLAGELVNAVRNKLSAGDWLSGADLVEDYKRKKGVDAEYLDAIGWLARGAEMLKQYDVAAGYVAELRREITEEKTNFLSPYGAAIEVEGRLLAVRKGRKAALRFWEEEFARAKAIALRSRIRKNINQLSLAGQPAPALNVGDFINAEARPLTDYKGRPVLLFLWAHWCGDCRGQAAALARVWQKYKTQGLVLLAPTRYYGTGADGKEVPPAEEKAHMAKVWQDSYAGLEDVPILIDTEMMVRYGVSATPTFALIDRKGKVSFYTPTRLTEAELSRRIEAVLKETP